MTTKPSVPTLPSMPSVPTLVPYLKYVNGFQLVVMGQVLPITAAQAKQFFAQLQRLEMSHE